MTERLEKFDDLDLGELVKVNEMLAGALRQDRASLLRAEALLKLIGHNAIGEDMGWAVFDLQDESVGGSNVQVEGECRQVLVMAYAARANIRSRTIFVPQIRIVSNEMIAGPDDFVGLLSRDVTLFSDNDAAYCVDGLVAGKKLDTMATYFIVVDGQLRFNGDAQLYTPTFFCPGSNPDDEEDNMFIFGQYDNTFDGIDAITAGQEILDMVKSRDPVYVYQD